MIHPCCKWGIYLSQCGIKNLQNQVDFTANENLYDVDVSCEACFYMMMYNASFTSCTFYEWSHELHDCLGNGDMPLKHSYPWIHSENVIDVK